jgi:hypothetical protein
MAYKIEDLRKEFGSDGKLLGRSTIWRWTKKGVINKPDIGGNGANPIWLTMPVKSKQTTNPST